MLFHRSAAGKRDFPLFLAVVAITAGLLTAACESPLDPGIELLLSHPEVELRSVRGSSEPLQALLTVRNAGGGRLGPVSCPAEAAAWLTCEVSPGNLVVLTADPSELTESPDPVAVPLSAASGATPVSVTVTLVVESPALSLSTTAVSFTSAEATGATSPDSAIVTVKNTGAGTLADLGAITCDPSDVRVECVVAPETGTLTLTADPAGLAPGTHVYPVTIHAPHAGADVVLSVLLAIEALPHIALSTSTVHFEAIRGTESPLARTVSVSNAGVGSLGTVSCPPDPAPWLACAVVGNVVSLTALPGELTSSPESVAVPVTATEATNSPQTIEVSLALEQPVLALSSYWANFEVIVDAEAGSPALMVIDVLNTGAGSLENLGDVTCSTPGSAPVTCMVQDEEGELALSVAPEGLTPGVTVYPVLVTAQHSGVTRTITVVVTTLPPPHPVLTPDELTFNFSIGDTEPVTQAVAVTNSGGGDLGEISCEENPAAWLTCTVEIVDGEEEIRVTASPSGLTESPPPVVIEVTASGAPDDPVELTVVVIVE